MPKSDRDIQMNRLNQSTKDTVKEATHKDLNSYVPRVIVNKNDSKTARHTSSHQARFQASEAANDNRESSVLQVQEKGVMSHKATEIRRFLS